MKPIAICICQHYPQHIEILIYMYIEIHDINLCHFMLHLILGVGCRCGLVCAASYVLGYRGFLRNSLVQVVLWLCMLMDLCSNKGGVYYPLHLHLIPSSFTAHFSAYLVSP